MLLLLLMLVSNCSKLNFPKESKFYSSLKPYGEEEKRRNVKSVIGEENVDFVIGKKDDDLKEKKQPKTTPNLSEISVDYSEAKTLLKMQEAEKKAYDKEIKKLEEQSKINVDYSETKTLLEIQEEEQKARADFEKEHKRLEKEREKNYTSSYSEYNSFQYGYEKTIGSESDFFC